MHKQSVGVLLESRTGGPGRATNPTFAPYFETDGNTAPNRVSRPPLEAGGSEDRKNRSRYFDKCRSCEGIVELTTDGEGNLVALNPVTYRRHACTTF